MAQRRDDLRGNVVAISGTGGGQGRPAALLFSRGGATVVGCDRKSDGLEHAGATGQNPNYAGVASAQLDLHNDLVARGRAVWWRFEAVSVPKIVPNKLKSPNVVDRHRVHASGTGNNPE
jgi:NAD(P)-dependent dehydrogenase (short-subunit alcohol dehydrogenase family)